MKGDEIMNDYTFTLRFSLNENNADPEVYISKLMEAGCDDALIGIGKVGYIAFDFTRESSSAHAAVISAIKDIKSVIPNSSLIEASPDLVGLSDVAELLNFSRQNMRKLWEKGGSSFPPPFHAGKPALWHLHSLLGWLSDSKGYTIEHSLIETAETNMRLNVSKQCKVIEHKLDEEAEALLS
jgi:hypothetical protein